MSDGRPEMFDKVLVPVDLTPKNRAAIEIAADLCAPAGKVTLLHVIETLDLPWEEVGSSTLSWRTTRPSGSLARRPMSRPTASPSRFDSTFPPGATGTASRPGSMARTACRGRSPASGRLEVPSYLPGVLSVSDLLLASDSIRSTVPVVTQREQLTIVPLRGTAVRSGDPLHFYFEIYGLAGGEADIGTYRAELSVEDSTRTNFAERLLRRGRDLLGIWEADDPPLSWERQVTVAERIPEYITVEAPALDAGEYVIRLRLTDLVNGNEAERVRRVRVLAREER